MSDPTINKVKKERDEAKKERDEWHSAWFEARALTGKAWWDGATWGFAQGLKDKGEASPYHIAERLPEIARSVSILLDTYVTAHLDVGLEVASDDPVMNDMLPLTYFVTRYNTGDQILFQYVNGKPVVMRIKTHDGLFMDTDGVVIRNPQSDLFHKKDEDK